jgi:hypothetical protein
VTIVVYVVVAVVYIANGTLIVINNPALDRRRLIYVYYSLR